MTGPIPISAALAAVGVRITLVKNIVMGSASRSPSQSSRGAGKAPNQRPSRQGMTARGGCSPWWRSSVRSRSEAGPREAIPQCSSSGDRAPATSPAPTHSPAAIASACIGSSAKLTHHVGVASDSTTAPATVVISNASRRLGSSDIVRSFGEALLTFSPSQDRPADSSTNADKSSIRGSK